MQHEFHYDVALSFAGEDREYVEAVARSLRRRRIRVFYDRFEVTKLWGADLCERLADIYKVKSRFTVIFISKHYVDKVWPRHECRISLSRALESHSEYILPVRLDDTEVPGLPSTISYMSGKMLRPSVLAKAIQKKVEVAVREEQGYLLAVVRVGVKGDIFSFRTKSERDAFRDEIVKKYQDVECYISDPPSEPGWD
jgi:hypothetical protein